MAVKQQYPSWEEIAQLTQAMVEDAQRGEWEACGAKAIQRQQLLASYFAVPVAAAQSDAIAAAIAAVQQSDALIESLAQAEFSQLKNEVMQFTQERTASRAYYDTP
ncbi:MAG: flagellar protein FliT [Gammaproteobacteria bacterium]|nr:flagellar protein FliT [Gammaproteobacteria bacterium]